MMEGECPGGFLCCTAIRNSVMFPGQSQSHAIRADGRRWEDAVFFSVREAKESVNTAATFFNWQECRCRWEESAEQVFAPGTLPVLHVFFFWQGMDAVQTERTRINAMHRAKQCLLSFM